MARQPEGRYPDRPLPKCKERAAGQDTNPGVCASVHLDHPESIAIEAWCTKRGRRFAPFLGQVALEQLLERHRLALLVIDAGFALDVVPQLRARGTLAPIICIGDPGDASSVIAVLKAGCDDYLTRPIQPSELVARLEARLREHVLGYCSATVVGQLDLERSRFVVDGKVISLRRKELLIAEYLLTIAPRAASAQELVAEALGTAGDGGTARFHICQIGKKCREAGVPRFIETTQAGYAMRGAVIAH